jgi:hypothetical protein
MKLTEIILFGAFLFTSFYALKKDTEVVIKTEYLEPKPTELTQEGIEAELKKAEAKFIKTIIRQSRIETGNYNCTGCSLDSNNLFGFKGFYSGKYLKFPSWEHCIWYYAGWQRGIGAFRVEKESDYQIKIGLSGFAEDTTYIQKLKQSKPF